jgi:hypothetical protein
MLSDSLPLVRIIKNWDFPDLYRQLPLGQAVWDGFRFIVDEPGECDYCIVLNKPVRDVMIKCPPQHLWSIIQEPPIPMWRPYHQGHPLLARIFTTDPTLNSRKHVFSQPALAWHVNKCYDEMRQCHVPLKEKTLSFITSNLTALKGHRQRLAFLNIIRGKIDFDLFGKGFNQVDDKWDGLAPYQYSISIENYSGPDYWSEKLADCFLAWTMPVYYGCTNVFDYFPPESMIYVDIQDPDAIKIIQQGIADRLWEKNFQAIAEARNRILNQYQLFPFIVNQIKQFQQETPQDNPPKMNICLPEALRPPLTWKEQMQEISLRLRSFLRTRTR